MRMLTMEAAFQGVQIALGPTVTLACALTLSTSVHGMQVSSEKAEKRVPVSEFERCMRIWDQSTHMTREEWAQACGRVGNERDVTPVRTGPARARK
jgi:hypothetical protein